MTLEEQYISMLQVVQESRDLLAEKLYKFKVITEDQYNDAPFYDLLQCIEPEEMHSYVILNLPNKPIEDPNLPHIQNKTTLHKYLYNNNVSKIITKETSLLDLNYIILKKTLFYKEFLKYELRNMNVDESLIKQAKTIKALIRLLDYIKRIKNTSIEVLIDETLNHNVENEIEVFVTDDTDENVNVGEIEIYLNGVFYNRQNIRQPCIIIPPQLGMNTIQIRYISTDDYFDSESEIYHFESIRGALVPKLTLKNTNINSIYYNIDYDEEDIIEGCAEDTWNMNINIKNLQGHSINTEIPFTIYLENTDHIIVSDTTDISGLINFNNINIPYHSNDFAKESINPELIKILEHPIIRDDEDILENLTFITSCYMQDGEIAYETQTFDVNNYLDDLNGCILNAHIEYDDITNSDEVYYDIFQTNKHIQISNIDNIKSEIGDLITDIVYKDETLYCNTVSEKTVYIDDTARERFLNLIIETTLENSAYNNGKNIYHLNLYYQELDIDDNLLTWYKDTVQKPDHILIQMINPYTGKIESDYRYKMITITDNQYTTIKDVFNTPYYNFIPSDELPYGKTQFTINICTNTSTYISQDINWQNVNHLEFNYQSDEYGIIDIYIGDTKLDSIETHSAWNKFEYNNIQELFNNTNTYNKKLKIVNVISYKSVHIDNIVIDKQNAIINSDFEKGLQGWNYNNGVKYTGNDIDGYHISMTNTKDCYTVKKYFNILSNFELPQTDIFYLNNTPNIYYKPYGQIKSDEGVIATINDTQKTIYTDENGLLNEFKNPQIGTYNVLLQSTNNEIQEKKSFSYEIKKPFEIINNTDSTKEAKYQIIIYDLNSVYNIDVIHNQESIIEICQININTANNIKYYNIIIPRNELTIGNNILYCEMNNYSEEENFILTIPNVLCVNKVDINESDNLTINDIERINISNNLIIQNVSINSNGILLIDSKNIQHNYDSIKDIVTNIKFENDYLKITKYEKDD